jgi:hypothetical protein
MDLSQSIPSFAKNANPMLLSTIFTSFIIPLQVHPMSQGHWPYSQAPMVAATIASARIIGLPRIRPPSQVVYVNELHTGPIYKVHPRKAFIREFVK